MTKENPTQKNYHYFQTAYDYFNKDLFHNKLPPCLITMQRRKGAYGYFHSEKWINAESKTKTKSQGFTDELALNPAHFANRSAPETLSTLVHEMVHVWQSHHGKPSRTGYHNKEWAQKMIEVGLHPSDTGKQGGKQTGQSMSHYIIEGGLFDKLCKKLIDTDTFLIPYLDRPESGEKTRKKKAASKTKYTCPQCDLNAWAKPDVILICGSCDIPLEAHKIT